MLDKKSVSNRSFTLMNSFWDIQQQFMESLQYTASLNNLSIPQCAVLMKMNHSETMTQKHVGEKTHLPKSTLSQAVDGLVKLNLLDRQHAEGNRREVQLLLTNEGKTLIEHIHKQSDGIYQLFHRSIETLTEKQFNELIHTHQQIITYFKKQGRDQTC